jgi:hypothetical protein
MKACLKGKAILARFEDGVDSRVLSVVAIASVTLSVAFAGCSAASADPAAPSCPTMPTSCPSPPPSWKTDVDPLIEKYCFGCHGPGGVETSKENFTTYQGVATKHIDVAFQLGDCAMPLADAGQPTDAERATIFVWASFCGAPNN